MTYYWLENPFQDRIHIHPQSWDKDQRVQATIEATKIGKGVVMELHSAHTEFYADARVPVGKIDIYAPASYKGMAEYVTTIEWDEDWEPNEL